jgi:hypothetical protein
VVDKVWSKTENIGKDIHGDPLIQKYATESDVVTVTAGIKRVYTYPGTCEVYYAKKSILTEHNHH